MSGKRILNRHPKDRSIRLTCKDALLIKTHGINNQYRLDTWDRKNSFDMQDCRKKTEKTRIRYYWYMNCKLLVNNFI